MNEERAARYQRLSRRARLLSVATGSALLQLLWVSGLSTRLRDAASSVATADASAASTVAVYVVLCAALVQAATLPLVFHRTFVLDRRFGLSSEPLGLWLVDHLKAGLLLLAVAVPAAEVVYLTLRVWPEWWWIPAAGVFVSALIAAARFGSLLFLRVFHRLEPLGRTALRERLLALSARAGVPVLDVLVVRLGGRTRRVKAALVGIGGARRIVVSDTLLDNFSDAEIKVVLAHEVGHHVRGDIGRVLALEAALITGGFAAGAALLAAAWGPLGLAGPADVAGLPLVVTGGLTVSFVARPLLNAASRCFERRADRFALALTNHPAAFISTMRRFAAKNLAEERPSRATLWMFHTHPAFADRIRVAEEFQAGFATIVTAQSLQRGGRRERRYR